MPVRGVETPLPPSPRRWATDTAGFISESARRNLDARLEGYQKATGHQVLVWIGKTTGGVTIEDWAVRAFKEWKIGRKGMDDGLALFFMAEDRSVWIEVGYGLEGVVPDAIASRIINETIIPRIRAGDPDGGVTAGVEALLLRIGGGSSPVQAPGTFAPTYAQRDAAPQPMTAVQKFLMAIFFMIVIAFFITHPRMALWLLMTSLSGGRGSVGRGYGGGGGGFSGGGGRSGGGGAGGSW